jgi:hypothetical protein
MQGSRLRVDESKPHEVIMVQSDKAGLVIGRGMSMNGFYACTTAVIRLAVTLQRMMHALFCSQEAKLSE